MKPKDFYSHLEYGLMEWVRNNPKITSNLQAGSLKKFLQLTVKDGLIVDICHYKEEAIDQYYSYKNFTRNGNLLINRLCLVMKEYAEKVDVHEFTVNVTVKKNIYRCHRRVRIFPAYA